MKRTSHRRLRINAETIRELGDLSRVRGGELNVSSATRTECTSGNCSDVCTGSTECTQTCVANSRCGCTFD